MRSGRIDYRTAITAAAIVAAGVATYAVSRRALSAYREQEELNHRAPAGEDIVPHVPLGKRLDAARVAGSI